MSKRKLDTRGIGTYYKQPSEIAPVGRYGVDFTLTMVDGEAITDATIVVTDENGTDLTATLVEGDPVVSDGCKVSAKYKAGEDGHTYKVTTQVDTDANGHYEEDFFIVVKNV